jgi:exosortase J
LLWFANPVPRAFSLLIDLPLQTLSAHIARSFAMHLGQPLTPDHLRLMFTPEFGMFIAPGCNGIRGSITIAFIALIAGYVYRFRWFANAAVVAGAVLLGYVFNLLRLCLLVLYYIIALQLPWLQNKAETADYIIGGGLFLTASFLLFTVIHHLRDASPERDPVPVPVNPSASFPYAQVTALLFTACTAGAAFASSLKSDPVLTRTAAERFPQTLGAYTLVRTWHETLDTGAVVYQWAEYVPASGSPVTIGISPAFTWHDPLICHTIRGEHPLWQGPLQLTTAALPVSFSSALYADGVTQVLEASTQCSGGDCNEFATPRTRFGVVYTRIDGASLLHHPAHSLPVVIRAEVPDPNISPAIARAQLARAIESFAASVNLPELTRP